MTIPVILALVFFGLLATTLAIVSLATPAYPEIVQTERVEDERGAVECADLPTDEQLERWAEQMHRYQQIDYARNADFYRTWDTAGVIPVTARQELEREIGGDDER